MKKNISIIGTMIVFLFSAFFISAQSTELYKLDQTNEAVKIESREIKTIRTQDLLQKTQAEMEQKRENMEKRKLEVGQKIENVEQKKADMEKRRLEMEKRREDFEKKRNEIRDSQKKDMADRIVKQINNINKIQTNHFTNVLERLDAVLQKIKSRAEKLSRNNQNVSAINDAILKAETSIEEARVVVLDQSQKEYIVNASTITNETSTTAGQNNLVNNFRDKFKLLKDQLKNDLFSIRDGVMRNARNDVHNVFKVLSQVPNVDREPVENLNNQ